MTPDEADAEIKRKKAQAEFVDRFKFHTAGLALYGMYIETLEGPMVRAQNALRIPDTVERLLRQMFDYLSPAPKKAGGGK